MSLGEGLDDEPKYIEAGEGFKDDLVCLSSMTVKRPQPALLHPYLSAQRGPADADRLQT